MELESRLWWGSQKLKSKIRIPNLAHFQCALKSSFVILILTKFLGMIFQISAHLGWEFRCLVPISGTPIISGILILFPIPKIPIWYYFWNSDVWRVRKSEFRFAIFGIPVICLRRNSVCLIVANLYWLQSMYNDLILMVHKLVAPLQHQTADQCDSCHWPAILNRWCNQCHWCASGKKQERSQARHCHPFSAPRNQCAMTTWSWPSCRDVSCLERYCTDVLLVLLTKVRC